MDNILSLAGSAASFVTPAFVCKPDHCQALPAAAEYNFAVQGLKLVKVTITFPRTVAIELEDCDCKI